MDNSRNIETPDARKFVFSRRLPKTGQTVSYQAGDDGDYEAGWSIGQRFIAKTIGGDQIALDRATGLMWARDFNAAGGNNGALINWANAIIYAEALNFAGFTAWKLPNIAELVSIRNYVQLRHFHNTFLNRPTSVKGSGVWSSTTARSLTTSAWLVLTDAMGHTERYVKTATRYILCCRKAF